MAVQPTDRPPKSLLHGLSLRQRKLFANVLGFLIVVGGGSLGVTLGFLIYLYFEGGLQLIQEVLIQKGPTRKATPFMLMMVLVGASLGSTLSVYFASWVIVKIGLLTEAERGPIEFRLNRNDKSK